MSRILLNQCLWVCGGILTHDILFSPNEVAALRERGGQRFQPKKERSLEEMGRLTQKSDTHVVLMWLRPAELKLLYPVLRERKNFSIVVDDWWICPWWFMREATHIMFRMYSGIAVRNGTFPFVTVSPPLLTAPE